MICPYLPFGRHKDSPLSVVPTDYLRWVMREVKLSSGLRASVAAELASRSIQAPDPPPRSEPRCSDHPSAGYRALWGEDSLGRRFIRSECRLCHRALGNLPQREPYTGMADSAASATPLLDALVGAEAAGVELHSDGWDIYYPPGAYHRLPPVVRDAVHQAKHQLARMITRRTAR
jgi:hypothetical protein